MELTPKEYRELADRLAPRSPTLKNCCNAFWVGGLICVIGQLLMNGLRQLELDQESAGAATAIVLVLAASLLTGLAVYDDIAKFAGAGTLVPITGFSNSISAPAVEFRTEGFITGTAVKMFTIAGPVLVYGTGASVIYGLIYWLLTR